MRRSRTHRCVAELPSHPALLPRPDDRKVMTSASAQVEIKCPIGLFEPQEDKIEVLTQAINASHTASEKAPNARMLIDGEVNVLLDCPSYDQDNQNSDFLFAAFPSCVSRRQACSSSLARRAPSVNRATTRALTEPGHASTWNIPFRPPTWPTSSSGSSTRALSSPATSPSPSWRSISQYQAAAADRLGG